MFDSDEYAEFLKELVNILPHEMPLKYHRDVDGISIAEGSAEDLTNLKMQIDHDAIFIRYISINKKFRAQGWFTVILRVLFNFCFENNFGLMFQSCNEHSKSIILRELKKFQLLEYTMDFLDNGFVDIDIAVCNNSNRIRPICKDSEREVT